MTGWSALLQLAERELALVRAGDAAALPAAQEERERLVATLGPAPAAARPVLDRLAAVQDQLVIELTLGRDEVARELSALHRGQGAVQGYRTAAGPAAARIDGRG